MEYEIDELFVEHDRLYTLLERENRKLLFGSQKKINRYKEEIVNIEKRMF